MTNEMTPIQAHVRTAVVVNDDLTQLVVLCGLLRKEGLKVLSFENAESALMAMDRENPPDLIITDLYMPGIDGWRFCRLLRSPDFRAFNKIPILAISAIFTGSEATRICSDLGANAFLTVPVNGAHFIEQVRALLEGDQITRPLKILIVDDSKVIGSILGKSFGAHGYQVVTALTIRAGGACLENTAFDIAVLDYHLPDGLGDTLLERFRAKQPDCICIMMTSDPTPGLAVEWMKMGAAAYVRKPFETEYLFDLCAKARRERSLLRVQDLLDMRTQELRESEERHSKTMKALNDGLWDWHIPSGNAFFSPLYYRLLEYDDAEFPASYENWVQLVHPDDLERATKELQRNIESGTGFTIDLRMKTKSGDWRWVSTRGKAVEWDRDGKAQRMVGTLSDITERKTVEQESELIRSQLIQAQKLESLGTLTSGVAHEINNPVMGVMGYAELICDMHSPDSPTAKFASEIVKEAQRIAMIVKNMLSFSRVDNSQGCPTLLNDIVDGCVSLVRTVMRHDRITLEVDLPDGLPKINCRSQQVQQVLMNLLTNARDAVNVKYPGNSTDKKIVIRIKQWDDGNCRMIRMSVEDNGPGIPRELYERIFEPFFTTKDRTKGTGLGLSISHGIVRDNGGKLSVESEIGLWTKFHVDFPAVDENLI